MARCYLVRHGHTALNSEDRNSDRIRGWRDVPLDKEGHKQAEELADYLADAGIREIFSSDLSRAKDTADALGDKIGVSVQSDEALRPWHLGHYQGESSARCWPEIKAYIEDKPDERVPDGESFNEFKDRFLGSLRGMLEKVLAGETVACFSHYRTLKLTEAWLEADRDGLDYDVFFDDNIEPGAILVIEPDGDKWDWHYDEPLKKEASWHTATVHYHYSPRINRDSIEKEGLRPNPSLDSIPAVYLHDYYDRLEHEENAPYDTWQVDTTGLELEPDPISWEPTHWRVREQISPERIRRISHKQSMAQKTGDPEVDDLLERFLNGAVIPQFEDVKANPQNYGETNPPQSWRTWLSEPGICGEMASWFHDWLWNQGISGWDDSSTGGLGFSGTFYDPELVGQDLPHPWTGFPMNTPEAHGYTDRSVPGASDHEATLLRNRDGRVYLIDWAAGQYGYRSFPMVQRLDDQGRWQRKWASDADADNSSKKEEFAGVGESPENPAWWKWSWNPDNNEFEVWGVDKDGNPHHPASSKDECVQGHIYPDGTIYTHLRRPTDDTHKQRYRLADEVKPMLEEWVKANLGKEPKYDQTRKQGNWKTAEEVFEDSTEQYLYNKGYEYGEGAGERAANSLRNSPEQAREAWRRLKDPSPSSADYPVWEMIGEYPLSGEWAGGPAIRDYFSDVDYEALVDAGLEGDYARIWEDGYYAGAISGFEQSLASFLGKMDEPGETYLPSGWTAKITADPPDWKSKYNYRKAKKGEHSCSSCAAWKAGANAEGNGKGRCLMFNDEALANYTCSEWTSHWSKESNWLRVAEEDEDWVPIQGQGEVMRGKPLDESGNLFQYIPEPQDYSVDEALTDLRDGGYRWQISPSEQPNMWRLQHKREPIFHDLSSRDLQLKGYNVYYQDPWLPVEKPMMPSYFLHDTMSESPGRIWATQRADVEGWQPPAPGALNEPWLREKHPNLWRKHWGDDKISEDAKEAHTQDDSRAQAAIAEDGQEAQVGLRQAQAYVKRAQEGYNWPSWEDIDELSRNAVDNHQGYRDTGLIEGAVGNTQMAYQYGQHSDIFDTAANLIAKIQRQQAIVEGNKRTAVAVGLQFLEDNGLDTTACTATEQLEDQLIWLVYNISDEGRDAAISELADFLRQHCKPIRLAALIYQVPFETYAKFMLKSSWAEVQAKAKRLVLEGKVTILVNTPTAIVAHVIGDGTDNNGTPDEHEVEISRQDPNSNVITSWSCDCAWADFAWGRTRKWKKFNGRICSHCLSAYWKSKSTPIDITDMEPGTEYKAPVGQKGPQALPGQLSIPVPQPTPMTHEPLVQEPVTPAPTAPPLPSKQDLIGQQPQNPFTRPKQPKPKVPQREQMQLFDLSPPPAGGPPAGGFSQPGQTPPDPTAGPLIPGTFSKWYTKEAMAERSGDPELDALIERYLQQNRSPIPNANKLGVQPLEMLRNPQYSWGYCTFLADDFASFLRQYGIDAQSSDLADTYLFYNDVDEVNPDPDDQPIDHAVTLVSKNGQTYSIDWTASQYGYKEFPMVQRLDYDPEGTGEWNDWGNQWQREWTSAWSR